MKYKFIILLVVIVFCSSAFYPSEFYRQEQNIINIVKESEQYACKIESDKSYGAGVLISENKILTALHVIKSEKSVAIFSDYSRYEMILIKKYVEHDLALLEIDKTNRKFVHLGRDIIKGQRALVFGCPDGYDFSVNDGIVSSEYRNLLKGPIDMFQIDATIDYGSSGSAVVNTQGQLIGIVNCKLQNLDGIGFANRIDSIKKFLNNQ